MGVVPVAASAGIFAAIEKGYFEAEGIQVEASNFDSAVQMVAPLSTGQLDVGGRAISAGLFNALARGVELYAVADMGRISRGFGYTQLMVRSDLADQVKSVADLKGRKVAINARGNSPEVELVLYLKEAGLTLQHISLSTIGYPEMRTAFANKGIDATIVTEPYATQIRRQGLARVLRTADTVYPDHQIAVIFYSPKWVQEKPDLARRWLVAYLRGCGFTTRPSFRKSRKPGPR